ncbi:hypothetical protein SAMN05444004_10659 [Jannaschia faecimaris]|uniref:Histidine kinase n=1 Tax=Jannaschia faecimaris TaxID=1244108 RepID=A0A1H3QC40_9RHOB|nr:DUF6446 family protein [Jannaschia faecimaris]SDZ10658.1 hypothetical protein SAMN05444004_10659 [Jannaschia faecimaris]
MSKFAVILILGAAIAMGAGLWYAQTRGYYAVIEGPVTLTLTSDSGLTTIPATDVQAIASNSSPLGFRACFAHDLDLAALTDEIAPRPAIAPAPTIAPPWFDCFDAETVGDLIDDGTASAFIAYKNAAFGVDRIVALTDDGRGFAWHELNDCGKKAYDGTAVGEACPDRTNFEPLIEGSL